MISVIVPVYNVEPYLRKCIESILNQSYENIEIILVDDGSTDGSFFICDEYQKKDKRISVIHQTNGGLSAARNAGLDIAKGDFISFIDSDDWIHKDYYKTLIRYTKVKELNIDIVQCGIIKTGKDKISNLEEILDNGRIYNGRNATKMLYEPGGLPFGVVWNKLYRKSLFSELRFPVGKKNEDEFLNYRLLYEANYVVNLNAKTYFYRQRRDSIMAFLKENFNLDVIEAYNERISYFKKHRDNFLLQKTIENYYNLLILKTKGNKLKDIRIVKLKIKYFLPMLFSSDIDSKRKVVFIYFVLGIFDEIVFK